MIRTYLSCWLLTVLTVLQLCVPSSAASSDGTSMRISLDATDQDGWAGDRHVLVNTNGDKIVTEGIGRENQMYMSYQHDGWHIKFTASRYADDGSILLDKWYISLGHEITKIVPADDVKNLRDLDKILSLLRPGVIGGDNFRKLPFDVLSRIVNGIETAAPHFQVGFKGENIKNIDKYIIHVQRICRQVGARPPDNIDFVLENWNMFEVYINEDGRVFFLQKPKLGISP